MTTLDQKLAEIHAVNAFDRELLNRTKNIIGLVKDIQFIDRDDPEDLAEYQLKAGDIRDELAKLDELMERESYARQPGTSEGPR